MPGNVKTTVRQLRKNQTESEATVWSLVRNRQINGRKFFRQYPIQFEYNNEKRFFVADFYCAEIKLVLEIDGKIHEQQREYDEMRTYIINQLGIKVIRFSNEEVKHTDEFIERLKKL
jgi:very-short-patch-repair endonuclease